MSKRKGPEGAVGSVPLLQTLVVLPLGLCPECPVRCSRVNLPLRLAGVAAATPRGSEGRAPPGPCGPRASMGRTGKANVCPRLSRRALGFYTRDAGVVQRTNLGILRALVCQVTPAVVGVPGVQPPAGQQFFRALIPL